MIESFISEFEDGEIGLGVEKLKKFCHKGLPILNFFLKDGPRNL
jgi:hypothetical protein